MKSVEISARSVEEALKLALEKLSLTEEDVQIEVLEEPSKGFLGILGGKMAKLKVTEKLNPIKITKEFVEDVVNRISSQVNVIVNKEEDYIQMELTGKNMGLLIGHRGETLNALQYIANLVANKNNDQERIKIIIDAEGYRKRRENTLVSLARRMADKVKQTGHRVILEPMNPQERRIIHTTLQKEYNIQTSSEGEEPFRKVIISLIRK
jgi:spoIIIJ-associated protein